MEVSLGITHIPSNQVFERTQTKLSVYTRFKLKLYLFTNKSKFNRLMESIGKNIP